jgi:ketosteroid isomerase-like protein
LILIQVEYRKEIEAMKLILAISILFVIVTAGCTRKPPEQTSSHSKAELLSQEHVWTEAFKNRDKETLTQILADKFVFTDDAGQVYNKDQYISAVIGVIKVESYTVDDTAALVYGDTGIVIGRWTGKVSIDAKDASGAFRFTDVFVHRDGRWQAVASQDTRIPEPKPNR